MARVYHEKQQDRLCGKHCLNNLLQGAVFDHEIMHQIAQSIEHIESRLLFDDEKESLEQLSEHHSKEGDFSIEVLFAALQRLNVDLVPGRHPDAAKVIAQRKFHAIVVQSDDHWFAIRKVFGSWLNLDSLLPKPYLISDARFSRWLDDPPKSTNVFLVIGELPHPRTPRNEEPWVVVPDIGPPSAQLTERPPASQSAQLPEKPPAAKESSSYKSAIVKEPLVVKEPPVFQELPVVKAPPVVKTPSNYEKLIDLGFEGREVIMALGLTGNDLEQAGKLLSLDRPVLPRLEEIVSDSKKPSALDAQLIPELNASVKEIYRAQTHTQVVSSFFQIYRLTLSYPFLRASVLNSSLRHALKQKRSITESSARTDMRKFFAELERKNPSYKRLTDMGFKDLEIRCATLLYPNDLDTAAAILLQPRSESAAELFCLLHSSTCEADAKANLLRVVQVAADSPRATPVEDLVHSLKGQKNNLGKTGLFTATRLLEYLDHEGVPNGARTADANYLEEKMAKKKMDGGQSQSAITLDKFPKPRSAEKRGSPRGVATKWPVTGLRRTPSASSTAIARSAPAGPGFMCRPDDGSPHDAHATDLSPTATWENYCDTLFSEHSEDKSKGDTAPPILLSKSDPFPECSGIPRIDPGDRVGFPTRVVGAVGKSTEERSGLSLTHGPKLSLYVEAQRGREFRLREQELARREEGRDRANHERQEREQEQERRCKEQEQEGERWRREQERGRIRDTQRDMLRAQRAREQEQTQRALRERQEWQERQQREREYEQEREQKRERIRRENGQEVHARAAQNVPLGGIIHSRIPDNREMRYHADMYSADRYSAERSSGGTLNLATRLVSRDALNTLGTDRRDRTRISENQRSVYDRERYRVPNTMSGFAQNYKPPTAPDTIADTQYYAQLWEQRQNFSVAQRRSASSGRVKELRPWR